MNLYSYHIFLFPFQWYFTGKDMRHKTLEERTSLKDLLKLFEGTNWIKKPYKTDTVLNYNEYNYFYDMVRDVMFDENNGIEDRLIANLFYDIPTDEQTFDFKVCIDPKKAVYKEYSLEIDSIILHLYKTGVGVLSFHLNNRLKRQSDEDDILRINQFARRIYPPFFAINPEFVGKKSQYDYSDFSYGLENVQKKELAKSFRIMHGNGTEDFNEYRHSSHFETNPFQFPGHLSFLFENIPITVDKNEKSPDEKKVYISPLIDDRMFVICWYGNDQIISDLKANTKDHCRDDKNKLTYLTNQWWYKFMFNDQNNLTCQNEDMMKRLIRKHTYVRWSDYGTFFGLNRYSFVCLTDSLETLKKNNAHFLVNHMQTMYYKLCELCLVQRACILRFSDEMAKISTMDDSRKTTLSERVSNLYKQYLVFVNRIYFREVTAQEQGIEMYNLLHEHMQIEKNVKELDDEIEELHSYINLVQAQKQGSNIELLTIIGALFVLPTFILSFIGMIYIPFKATKFSFTSQYYAVLVPLVLSLIIYFIIDKARNKKISYKLYLILTVTVAVVLGLTFLMIHYFGG